MASDGTEALILALLVENASESELRKVIAGLQVNARGDAEVDRVEQLGSYALELHHARADDRRRALLLTALSETATELASHRDSDELLQAICRRARVLLGTDVAYVTLRDDALGDTYVHTTDGIVSEEFRMMRLAVGTGLGGLVAQTGGSQMTADYTRDVRLVHSSDIDRRVATEGLRGIVAAPLKCGHEVVGVLMSGSRQIRRFDPSEVSLFTSLASHAAIALQNARLIQDAQQAVADLAQAHEVLQRHTARVEQVGEIHGQLAALALQGAEVGELLDAVVSRLPGEIELFSATGEPLETRGSLQRSNAGPWIDVPVLGGAEELGRLRLRVTDPQDIEEEVLQRAAVLVASLLLAQQASSDAQHRNRSMLLEALLAERGVSGAELHGRAMRAGMSLDREHVVLAIAPHVAAERWAWLHAARSSRARRAVVGTVGGRIVAVEPGADAIAAAADWSDLLTAGGGGRPTIGAAAGAMGAEGVRAAHGEAVRAVHILLALGRAGSWATVGELGIFGQMLGRAREGELRQFLARLLGPIKDYDERRSAGLQATLEAYLNESGHLAKSARRLGIHINTLYHRLERLDELLEDGWREPDRRLELHLAVRLDALRRELKREQPW